MDTEEASYIIGIFDIDQRLHLQSQFQLQQLKEQLQNLSIMVSTEHQVKDYRDGCVPKESDIFIAVMGVTGAGKSTFISKCTTREVKIGHELQACVHIPPPILVSKSDLNKGTQDVTVYHCSCFKGVNVFLIDTPGFDDTHRSDKEVLKEIACWLGASYRDQVKLHGIIYLHRITDPRMQGSARKNLLMFKKLCGPAALKHVILATTMWERLTDEDMGLKREQELIETEDFWGWMKKQGSQVIRHQNTWESAMDVLGKFVKPQKRPIPLQIQTEIVDGNRTLDETSAGQELQHALSEEREKFKRELEELQAEMKEALTMRDEVAQDMIRESREELNQKLLELERDRADLKVSLETMYSKKLERLEQEIQQQQRTNESFRGMFESMKLGQERSAVTHGLHHEKIREQEQNHKTMLKQQQSKSKAQIDPLKAYSKGLTKMALYDFTGNQPDRELMPVLTFVSHANRNNRNKLQTRKLHYALSRGKYVLVDRPSRSEFRVLSFLLC
jgi:GTP-binding protein EngB required for normal cell division